MRWVSKLRNHLRPSHGVALPSGDQLVALAVLPDHSDRQALHAIAERAGWSLQSVPGLEMAREALQHAAKPVVIVDRDLPGCDWRQVIETLVAAAPGSVVLLASSTDDERLWEEVVRLGGYDVLRKPFEFDRAAHAVHFAWMYWKFNNRHLGESKTKGSQPHPL